MTAGSILVPQVIPLRITPSGKVKHEIDTNTPVEIKSDTPDVTIYYTTDGSKPQLFNRLVYRDHNTFMYKEPITLPDGKITVKALAITKDYRESAIVTKTFVVKYATPSNHVPLEDNESFLKDISKQEVENEFSDLSLSRDNVNMKSKLHCSAVAGELQGLSEEKGVMPFHFSGPHVIKNFMNATSNRKESDFAIFSSQSQGKVLCRVCGAGNPVHVKHCVICDSQLPEEQMPGQPQCNFTCFKCGASNYPYNRFCDICSVHAEHSSRLGTEDILKLTAGDCRGISENDNLQTWEQSLVSLPTSRTELLGKKEQGTQTTGLFYPSNTFLKKKECELISQKEKQNKKNNHSPLLTAISPGRGYWRKQLDHVCAHLRSYTQNNLDFRTLIGEPHMGKLISATVNKDDYQVSLQINYALAVNKDNLTSKPMTFDDYGLSPSKADRKGLCESQASSAIEVSQRMSNTSKKIKMMTETRKSLAKEDSLSSESRQLLNEVGPEGHGEPFLIEQLIDEGADPNCTDYDGQPALTLAVLNNHHEVIPVLVQKGANINYQSGLVNNTALHEALLLGMKRWECIEALLGCNADIKKKNTRGLSACDFALKSGSDKIIALFASKLEETELTYLIQSNSN